MIHIIGLGIGEQSRLIPAAQQALSHCSVIIGSLRQRQLVADLLPEQAVQLDYPTPLSDLQNVLKSYTQQYVAVLASGDPLFYGIGDWLTRHIAVDQLQFYPNISSIQIAFARIKQAWQTAKIVSLHGRPLISLRPQLRSNTWYALLTDKNSQPQHIAQELIQQGFDQSKLWICAALGTPQEQISAFDCQTLKHYSQTFHPLHVTLVYTQGTAHYLPECMGINDQHFVTGRAVAKGMITKKTIRLAALNLLQTQRDDIAWDIGAGCGGMAVEWAYWYPHMQLYAVECHPQRLQYLHENCQKFGVIQNLHIIAAIAPKALHHLPTPKRIFIGGSNGAMSAILDYCWEILASAGCMVISCVTEECKYDIMHFIAQHHLSTSQIEQLEITVAHAESLAGKQLMRPQLPVRLIKISKPICSQPLI